MNITFSKTLRVPSLLLAAMLQLLPIARAALPVTQNAAHIIVILFRWAVGSTAALGGVQAMSGASTTINSPRTARGTNGQLFTLRLTTAPHQSGYWTAPNLPSGLALLGSPGSSYWRIEGTPTISGVFSVPLTAKEAANSGASRTVTATLTLTIVSLTNSPPSILTQPTNKTVNVGQNAAFTVVASGTPAVQYQWRFGGVNLSQQTNASLSLTAVSTNDAGGYDVVVLNSEGSVTSSVAQLTVNVPVVIPAITTPLASQSVTEGQPVSFTIGASGTGPLSYFWRKNGAVFAVNLSPTFTLASVSGTDAGSYSVIVSNAAGQSMSAAATLTVNAVPVPPSITAPLQDQTVTEGQPASFTIGVTGTGPLSYFWRKNDTVLAVNTSPTFSLASASLADAGSYSVIISNAAGQVPSAAATLTVHERPASAFSPGTYNGLFFNSNDLQHASSGFFSAIVRPTGDFTARLQNGKKKFSIRGRLDAQGRATNLVARVPASPLTVELNFRAEGDAAITGRVTDGVWSSDLLAHRAAFQARTNPATALAGRYTLMIPGAESGTTAPLGSGVGAVTVTPAGLAALTGTLADGNRLTQRVGISAAGEWPFYMPLYAGRGAAFGWLQLRPTNGFELTGTVNWIRPPGAVPKLYTNGFTLISPVAGSVYTPPVGGIFPSNSAWVIFNGGNLSEASANLVTLAARGKVINAGTNKLTLTLAPATGLFKGTVKLPEVSKPMRYQGVVLPRLGWGSGSFSGTNEIGDVHFAP